LTYGLTTAKSDTVYFDLFELSKQNKLEVPDLGAGVAKVTLLAGRQHFEPMRNGVSIEVPAQVPDSLDAMLEIKTS